MTKRTRNVILVLLIIIPMAASILACDSDGDNVITSTSNMGIAREILLDGETRIGR